MKHRARSKNGAPAGREVGEGCRRAGGSVGVKEEVAGRVVGDGCKGVVGSVIVKAEAVDGVGG